MILDRIENADRYTLLHPGFKGGFGIARQVMTQRFEPGRYQLDGERLFVIVANGQGTGRDNAKLEVHRRYIDIQLCMPSILPTTTTGDRQQPDHTLAEQIGWRLLADCHIPEADYDSSRDIRFFLDRPETWLVLPPGMFAIFYPDDAHAPLAGKGLVSKAVIKVAADW